MRKFEERMRTALNFENGSHQLRPEGNVLQSVPFQDKA